MDNTPPVSPIDVANVVLKWVKAQDGVEEVQQINQEKALSSIRHLTNVSPIRNDVESPRVIVQQLHL
jgi:phosphoserine aminotransferase